MGLEYQLTIKLTSAHLVPFTSIEPNLERHGQLVADFLTSLVLAIKDQFLPVNLWLAHLESMSFCQFYQKAAYVQNEKQPLAKVNSPDY